MVVFRDTHKHKDIAEVIRPKIQVIFAYFKSLGFDILIDSINGSRLDQVGHDALHEISYHPHVGGCIVFGQIFQYQCVEMSNNHLLSEYEHIF